MIITMIGLINVNVSITDNFMYLPSSYLFIIRHDSGRVMIEGCVSEDYYMIRDLLYQQYAIV